MLAKKIQEGYSELEWMNEVHPFVYRTILRFVKRSGEKDAWERLKDVVTARTESKKRAVYLSAIKELKAIKKRYTAGDTIAKMILVNHGFLREKKSKR